MAIPINVTFAGSLLGATEEGALEPTSFSYGLESQHAHTQKSVKVLPTDVAKPITFDPAAIQGEPGDVQQLFLVNSDHQITFTLNGGGPVYEIKKPDGIFVLCGMPEVFSIELTGFPSVTATVHMTKVIGAP
jgi:hypothetical protein